MRALLTPEVAHRMGIVLFRPGAELMHLFMRGRVLLEPEPEEMASFSTGAVPAAIQPLADDPVMRKVFENDRVIQRAGGLPSLEQWLSTRFDCQWPHSSWHDKNFTTMRHPPGSIRLCWHCDHTLSGQHTEQLAGIAAGNLVSWILEVILRDSGFPESHILTLPELCWWMVRNDLADVIPESVAHKGLRLSDEKIRSVMRESDIEPSASATNLVQEKAKKILTLSVDPESPESFMLRPKRRRWINETYTRWVKTQPCECCRRPADDPHHIVGHGMGGTATKAHDLFVIPLCRECHDELHADVPAFEQKHGTQLELLLRFMDRALAIGVIAKA